MKDYTDLIGKRYGRLLIEDVEAINNKPHVICNCDCGKKTTVLWYSVKYGLTKSCGCLVKDYKDMSGKVFGDLLVLRKSDVYKNNNVTYLCICKCGNEVICRISGLVSGKTTHCGCKIKRVKYLNRQLYEVWKGMRARCRNKNHIGWGIYGGKGVRVCEEWDKSFVPFYNWCISNGWKPRLEIDKDIKGNGLLYSPGSCCIVSKTVNMRASSIIKMSMEKAMEVRASSLNNIELAKIYKVHPSTIWSIKQNKTWRV